MLGHWMYLNRVGSATLPMAMVASAVSSKMLRAIAVAEGFRFEETLTGFKWIGSRSVGLRNPPPGGEETPHDVVFGYEEAIGFCCGDVVPDKDGISAMGVFAQLANHCYKRGKSVKDHMQGLYDKYGEFVTMNGYFFCNDPGKTMDIFERIRNGGEYMKDVKGYVVSGVRDLLAPGEQHVWGYVLVSSASCAICAICAIFVRVVRS